jgi:transposase
MKSKQVKFYIGLDVHQDMTAYAVRSWKGEIVLGGECATRFEDLFKILESYLHSCVIGLEACTSYYHIYWSFKNNGYGIRVANTLRIRQLVVKNDRLDAERLSDMLRLGTYPTSYVPNKKLMELRSMINIRHNFVEEQTRFKNQISSCLAKHGLRINERTKFSKKWTEQLLLILAKFPQIKELHYGYEHYKIIEHRIEQITAECITHCKLHWNKEFEVLQTIPGIAEKLACYLIADICPIVRFKDKKKLRRYAGVIPCSQESGGKTYGSYLPKGSSRGLLRWALIQASWAAVKGKNNLAKYYNKKKKTRLKTKAIMAVASSMSDIVYHVLNTKKPYIV